MGKYLDRLNDEFATITEGIDEVLNRAADENRDLTDQEAELVEREQAKAEDRKKAIEHYSAIELTRAKVAETRARVPASPIARSTTVVTEPDPKPEELFRSAGDYAVTAIKAMRGDKDAAELIQRATAHQTTADNPGLIPEPILGPVVTAVGNERPFIQSITNKALPTGSFKRPTITQHVAVDKQTAEKAETASRKLLVDKLDVLASTYAGHLNVSRQDIKWSDPGIMQILIEDFGHEYAVETDHDAVTQFEASLTADPVAAASSDAAGIRAAVFAAAGSILGDAQGAPLPDTIWAAVDVWSTLGSIVNDNGVPAFPSVTPTSSAGNPLGLKLVVDPWLAPGTAVVGPSRFLEWYEDVDGFVYVDEPNVLGQLVGYAGYGAFLNTKPELFIPITGIVPAPPAVQAAKK